VLPDVPVSPLLPELPSLSDGCGDGDVNGSGSVVVWSWQTAGLGYLNMYYVRLTIEPAGTRLPGAGASLSTTLDSELELSLARKPRSLSIESASNEL